MTMYSTEMKSFRANFLSIPIIHINQKQLLSFLSNTIHKSYDSVTVKSNTFSSLA